MNLPGDKLAQQTAEVGLTGRDAIVYYASSATVTTLAMTTRMRSLVLTTADNHLAVTLPPVAESAGMWFCFYLITRGGSYDVTVADDADDVDFTSVVLNAANESLMLFSNGTHWFAVDGTTPATIT